MITTLKTESYRAFGFCIQSSIPFPELQLMEDQSPKNKFDIEVDYAELSELWDKSADSNKYFCVTENRVLFHVPDTAIYCIEGGNRITVSPFTGAHSDKVRLYLLGTCMGVLLMQRKILPLHGSAVVIDGKAYAIIGDSGAGKSTLASAFLKKGYQLISDDVIPVSFSKTGIPLVTPAYPQQKLWEESLEAFDMDANNFNPIIEREKKFAVPVVSQFAEQTVQLAGIYELVKAEGNDVSIRPITNLMRFPTLFYHTYRNFLLSRLGLMEWHFQMTANIVEHTHLYQIQRPMKRFTADYLTEVILQTVYEKRDIR